MRGRVSYTFEIEKQTMKYTDVRNNPKKFLALTGVNIDLFDEILPWFEEEHDLYLRYHDINGKKRSGKRAGAIYSNSPLPTVADRLFFILVYMKNNPGIPCGMLWNDSAAMREMDSRTHHHT